MKKTLIKLILLTCINISEIYADYSNFDVKIAEGHISSLEIRVTELEDQMREYATKLEDLEYEKNKIINDMKHENDYLKSEIDNVKKILNLIAKSSQNNEIDIRLNNSPFEKEKSDNKAKKNIEDTYIKYGKKDSLIAPNPSNSRLIQEEYKIALALFDERKYYEAELNFKKFLNKYNKHDLASEAYYWLGESFYKRSKFEEASSNYLKSYRNNPLGNKAADSLFKLAKSLSGLNKMNEACATFYKLLKEFPSLPVNLEEQIKSEKVRLGCKK